MNITFLLTGELRGVVQRASEKRQFEKALFADVQKVFPGAGWKLRSQLSGLVAEVSPHEQQHEGSLSAADLGIVIRRPRLRRGYTQRSLKVSFNRGHGLLVQAKLGKRSQPSDRWKWGSLTDRQQELIPELQAYYSLLLYRLTGRRLSELAPFGWQLCHEHSVEQMREWLRCGIFPQELRSSQVIEGLGAGRHGTTDETIIDSRICPERSQMATIEIRIDWPDDSKPPGSLVLRERPQKQHIKLRQ